MCPVSFWAPAFAWATRGTGISTDRYRVAALTKGDTHESPTMRSGCSPRPCRTSSSGWTRPPRTQRPGPSKSTCSSRPAWRRISLRSSARCSRPATRRSSPPRTWAASRRRPTRTPSRRSPNCGSGSRSASASSRRVQAKDLVGAEERKVSPPWLGGKWLRGDDYLVQVAVPNFFFHATMAYAILRHNGVDARQDGLHRLDPDAGRLTPPSRPHP